MTKPIPESWTKAARAEAAKAPPPSPKLIADLAALMGWVPASRETVADGLADDERAALDAVVDSWGPLTREQRERLRPVLAGQLASEPEALPQVRWADTEDGKRIVGERRAEIRERYERLYAAGATPDDLDPNHPSKTLGYRMSVELMAAEASPLTEAQKRRLRPILAGGIPMEVLQKRWDALPPERREELERRHAERIAAKATEEAGPVIIAAPAPPDAPPPGGPSYLYRYRDACGCLLYVGITDDLDDRDVAHRRDSPWHGLAVKREFDFFPTRDEAEEAERLAVLREKPAFNIALRRPADWNRSMVKYVLAHGPSRGVQEETP